MMTREGVEINIVIHYQRHKELIAMPNAKELWRKFQNEDSPVPKARRQFVGREDARRAWYTLLDRALEQDFKGYYILHFHGVGGMGKSTLLRQLRQEMEEGTSDTADVEKLHHGGYCPGYLRRSCGDSHLWISHVTEQLSS